MLLKHNLPKKFRCITENFASKMHELPAVVADVIENLWQLVAWRLKIPNKFPKSYELIHGV